MKKSFVLISILFTYLSIGQSFKPAGSVVPTIFSESPNAFIFKKFGDTPVSLFNGTPNISIPLYHNKNEINLPISLSYHIGSITPDQLPSWVGLGWNLNVGGSIIRNIKGIPDEILVPDLNPNNILSYFDNYQKLDHADWASRKTLDDWLNSTNLYVDKSSLSPDEFIFNVNGLSGSFFLNHKGKWIVKSNQNIDIKINFEMSEYRIKEVISRPPNLETQDFILQRTISGFTLTDEKGFIYEFGYKHNSIEFSTNSIYHAPVNNCNILPKTWYITRIISPKAQYVDFEYENTNVTEDLQADLVVEPLFKSYISRGSEFNIYLGISSVINPEFLERIYEVRLKQIISNDYTINFNSSLSNQLERNLSQGNWGSFDNNAGINHYRNYNQTKHLYKLNSIEVKSNLTSEMVFGVKFNYTENTNERLFLNSLYTYKSDENIINEKFNFEYNSQPLPDYNAEKNDHWGFYNGIQDDVGIDADNPYSVSRLPNPDLMMAGILKKIIYPTGGFTIYEYEPNDFSKVVNINNSGNIEINNAQSLNEIGGGIRISKTSDYSSNLSQPISKKYLYIKDLKNNDSTSTGILSHRPSYKAYIYQRTGFPFHYFSNRTISSFNSDNRDNVTYTKVYIKNDDGSYVENVFSNYDNGYLDKPQEYKFILTYDQNNNPLVINNTQLFKSFQINSLAAERGNLLEERKISNTHQLHEETIYKYNTISDGLSEAIRGYDFAMEDPRSGDRVIDDNRFIILKANAFLYYTNQINLIKKEHSLFDLTNNSSITKTTNYIYNSSATIKHHQLKYEEYLTSDNKLFQTKYFYPQDQEMEFKPNVASLIAKNMIGVPLVTQTFTGTEKLSEQEIKYGVFSGDYGNLLLPQYVLTKKGTDGDQPTQTNKITFNNYDTKGNITEYTLESGIPVSIIWGYNQSLPIAKIENATNAQIATALSLVNLSTINETNLTAINNLRTNATLSNIMVTTFTYIPLVGVSTITDPKGDKTTYMYDEFNRLKSVKDKNGNILSENEYHYKN